MAELDPASLAVLLARLSGVAEEMLTVLRRSASSPNIKERADCSTALFTAAGELLAQSESIPVHLGSMPASVRSVVDALGELAPGEQAVVNDPYAGGTHLNDVTAVAPVHVGGVLVGWAANRAHHADVGGAEPGSIPADATHIAEEGLRMPPVRLTGEVQALFLAASRTPGERSGDLDAQVGANRLGAERLAEVVAEGWPLDEVLAYGERRMRAALAALPDGTWAAEDVLDSVGAGLGPGRIMVRVTVEGSAIHFDFAGTDPQSPGNVNAVRAVTESAVAFALRSATDPTIPANGGALRPVRIDAPGGSLVAATWPAAVGAGNVEVSQRVADVCLRALAEVAPERVGAASQGTMNNVLIGGSGTGLSGGWVYYETIAGGQGGRPGGPPGMSGVQTAMTNTKSTPTEALERAYPLRVRKFRLRRGSGGAGLAPGGEGIEKELEVLEDCTLSLITERRVSQPWGLAGGEAGAVGENWLLPGGDEARAAPLPDKVTVRLRAGDVLRVLTPGAGGWGRALRVRPMTATDVADVQAVGLAAGERFRTVGDPRIARCAGDPPVSEAVLLQAIERGLAWVSLDGEPEAIVGFLVADVLDDAVHVEEVAVLPVFGGRGHASALLDALAGSAGDHGFRALTLTTFRDVEFNRPLYERRGFRVLDDGELTAGLARRRADEDESGLPAEIRVCMRRDLG